MKLSSIGYAIATALTALLASCSFDMASHPQACDTNSDCEKGYYCYKDFCVLGSGSVAGNGGSAGKSGGENGATGGTNVGGTGAGSSGSGAGSDAGGSQGTGTGGRTGSGGSNAGSGDAAMSGDGGGSISTPDGGTISMQDAHVTVPPYSACATSADCNSNETCRISGTKGVCAQQCTQTSQCPPSPPIINSFNQAQVSCGNNQCRIDCGLNRGSADCPSGMTCVTESGSSNGWQSGMKTCYP